MKKKKNLRETVTSHLNRKLRSACKKDYTIKIPHKDRKVINRLSKNLRLILPRQDKGRGIVIMGKGKHTEKSMNILNTKQFCKLEKDSTKAIEINIQRTV